MIRDAKRLLEITYQALDLAKLCDFVMSETCGAINSFVGTVRSQSEGRAVLKMEYHGYPEMAEKVLASIIAKAYEQWAIEKVAVQHRLGTLELKEASIMIVVSSPHRKEAFEACRFIIEEIKKELPVWKKEHFADNKKEWKHFD